MVEFHSTINGRKYYENYVPRIATALEKIAMELEKLNEEKDSVPGRDLEQIANELAPFEPALARLLRQYI